MAELPHETITTVLNLERRLLQIANRATATGFIILQQFGETEETIPELEELENVRERARAYYTRLYRLLFQISESQPVGTSAMMNLLSQSIEDTQAIADASEASIQEIKRNWNLP